MSGTVDFAPDTWLPRACRVAAVRAELADTVSLELRLLDGAMPSCEPGQFNMLYAFGIGEVPISVSGMTRDGAGIVHTVRNVGAVSRALVGLAVGEQVGLRGPFGIGWPIAGAAGADLLILAGGLGLAPLRPAVRAVLQQRSRFGRVTIVVGSRNPAEILYRAEIEAWRQRPDVDVQLIVDYADRAWDGHVGVVPAILPQLTFDPDEAVALMCGPEVMMRFTARALLASGVASDRIYLSFERNMKCATGYCGHCQFGPKFVCKDGPVMRYERIARLLAIREV